MSDALAPAAALAAHMDKTATRASADYLAARRDLLAEEIELRRHTERVAEMRRTLPQGPVVDQDYVFRKVQADGRSQTIRLSELFANGSDSLVVYCYMFPRHTADTRAGAETGELASLPVSQQPCPSCTGLLDQLDGAVPHFEAGGGNFVVAANAPPEHLAAVARDRGWRHLTLLSSTGNGFKKAFHAEDPDGQQEPMTLVFQRDAAGAIRLFWTSDLVWAESDPGQHHRAAGTIEPFWNLFDLTPGGRPDFDEQLQYPCCAGEPAKSTDVDREARMITITALKWVPPFAQGQVRDHRVRWVLNEVGWPYQVRLLDTVDQQAPEYRAEQPFGQVPVLEEDGRPPLFETGAILLDVATRAGRLLPRDDGERASVVCWLFAALNSLEPPLANLAEVDFFIEDEELKSKRRPDVVAAVRLRLDQLAKALGSRDYLVADEFTVADMMTSSVMKIIHHTDLLDDYPTLARYRDRCFDHPSYRQAIADQCAAFSDHSPEDMKYELKVAR